MLCPDLPYSWMLINLAIHRRLCKAGLISFIMTITAIANQIDHEIFAELLAVSKRGPRGLHARDWIICIDMNHWNFKALCEVTGEHAAARFALIRSKP